MKRYKELAVGVRLSWDDSEVRLDEPKLDEIFRPGSGHTIVLIHPTVYFKHVSGPVYIVWEDGINPHKITTKRKDLYLHAECAHCDTMSRSYTMSHRRYAQHWAHNHRCGVRSHLDFPFGMR